MLVPARRRLWSKAEMDLELFAGPTPKGHKRTTTRGKRGGALKSKSYEMAARETERINSALSDETDVAAARCLQSSREPQRVFQGMTPGHDAFVLNPTQRKELIDHDRRSRDVIYPYLVGREMISADGTPIRYLIDFEQRDITQAASYVAAFKRVEMLVLPDRKKNAEKGKDKDGELRPHHKQFLERWWRLAWDRADMLAALKQLNGRFIYCSRVTKRPVFVFVDERVRPGDALQTFAFDDDYSFGILQSGAHWLWFITKCSKLKSDFRYTPDTVFDSFPWPQSPTK